MPLKWLLLGLVISQTQAVNLGKFLQEAPKSSPWIEQIRTQKKLAEIQHEARAFTIWEVEGEYEGKSSLDSRFQLQIIKDFSLEKLNKILVQIKKESARIQLLQLEAVWRATVREIGLGYVSLYANVERQRLLSELTHELQRGLDILNQRSRGGSASLLQVELFELRLEDLRRQLRDLKREEVEVSQNLKFLSGRNHLPKEMSLEGLSVTTPSIENREDLAALDQALERNKIQKQKIQQELGGGLILGAGAAMNPEQGKLDETVITLGYKLPQAGERNQALREWTEQHKIIAEEASFARKKAGSELSGLIGKLRIVETQLNAVKSRNHKFTALFKRMQQAFLSGEINLSEWLDGIADAMSLQEEVLDLQVEKATLQLQIQIYQES